MAESKRSINPLFIILILSGVFFSLFLTLSALFYFYRTPAGAHRHASSSLFSSGSVGIVEVTGVIMDSKRTLARLESLEEDDDVKAIVVRLNSPGGSVAPSQEIYEAVKGSQKPVVVSMGSVAASGAYYIACGAKKVFANPGTLTGSIGVIMEFANLQKLYDWAKVQRYSIKTGRFKDSGAEYREMAPEERALFQEMINDVLAQFKSAVGVARNLSEKEVTAIADGRIFSGQQAKAAHLVDELGTLDDAIREAAKLAHLKGKPHVVRTEKVKRGLLDFILEDSSRSNESSSSLTSSSQLFQVMAQLVKLILRPGSVSSLLSAEEETLGVKKYNSMPGIYSIWGGGIPPQAISISD